MCLNQILETTGRKLLFPRNWLKLYFEVGALQSILGKYFPRTSNILHLSKNIKYISWLLLIAISFEQFLPHHSFINTKIVIAPVDHNSCHINKVYIIDMPWHDKWNSNYTEKAIASSVHPQTGSLWMELLTVSYQHSVNWLILNPFAEGWWLVVWTQKR